MGKIFGIDLGTTYSCISYVDEYGKAQVITNEENKPVTPSVVYFETADNAPVGDVAKENLATDPANVCTTVKRQMGNRDWFFSAHGKEFSAETISSLVLKKLAKDASEKLGDEVVDVVITCPAYFGITEKEATKNAGLIAGLNVLSIINEPTAAAISYGLDATSAQTVMIYDLGGGTFDVTIIKVVSGESISVVATGGDHNLGGKDWDEAIRSYVIEQFNELSGVSEDIYDDMESMGDLELKCENTKKSLSKMDKTSIKIIFGGGNEKIEITRDKFNEITQSLLDSTVEKTNEMLEQAALKGVTTYDKILLVGGSTRMPQVKDRLLSEYPNAIIEAFDPDMSVSKGAAIYGMNIAAFPTEVEGDGSKITKPTTEVDKNNPIFKIGGGTGKPIIITDVTSKSLGVELICDGESKVVNLITMNSPIPTNETIDASTVEANQTEIALKIYENNIPGDMAEIDQSRLLVEDSIKNLPQNLPQGSPVQITFMLDAQGMLRIKGLEVTGNNKVDMEVQIEDAMTAQEVEEARKIVSGITIM